MSSIRRRLHRLEMAGPPEVVARGGFLTLRRARVRHLYADGQAGPWYAAESCWPPFLDAVVLLLYSLGPDGALVGLRRAMRPTLPLRALWPELRALDGRDFSGAFWEAPAGGVEPADLAPGGVGLAGRARLEAWEEAGLRVAEADFTPLGPSPLAIPAFVPERLHLFAAAVRPEEAQDPPGDGHPMEEGAEFHFVELAQALEWCREGKILDMKTELGLRRLAERLAAA